MSIEWLKNLKEIILAQDPTVNEVLAEVLEFTHSFLFEEEGEFVYGLTQTVDAVVFHSPLLGENTPLHPEIADYIRNHFATLRLEDGSLHIILSEISSRESFIERFGTFISLIATLRHS